MRAGLIIPPRTQRAPSRVRRTLLALLVALASAYGGALFLASRPAFEAALRDRIVRTLRVRLGDVVVGGGVAIDPLFRLTFGPVEVPAARPGDPPVVHVERVRVRARLAPLLLGRAEPASIRLYDVTVDAGEEGRALHELADRLTRPAPRHAAPSRATGGAPPPPPPAGEPEEPTPEPALHVKNLTVRARIAGRAVALGPAHLRLTREREPGGERLHVAIALASGGEGAIDLTRVPGGWSADARLDGVRAASLPAVLRGRTAGLAEGTFAMALTGEAPLDLASARGRVRATAEDVVLAGARLGPEPIGPASFTLEGELTWEGPPRRLALRGGRAELLGAIRAQVSGEVRLGPGAPFALDVRADAVDFGEVVAALPPALAPPPEAPRPAGTLDARLALAGPLVAPAAWTVDAALDLRRLREAARQAPPVALRAPFVYEPPPGAAAARPVRVDPASPDFVPVAELPAHVVRAVTASEDAGFFAHAGFDFEELRNAFAQGAEQGRVVRGGSTITQQLAKNLYLSRDRTLARKVREAFATIALEATVPKPRLLEIYLNVAEWGPGLRGIGPAARHWFGQDARALTPRQAAFLATVIPNPVRFHVMWERGAPSPAWNQRVDELLLKLSEQGVLDEPTLLEALAEPLVFANPQALAAPLGP